ncbi:hypothetical protein Ddye_009850 [Dipteronia dyeriana]|uniref:Reverse transcriptase domain-containing protein n=1 Tax=Dipteronia dyeriana TaxID=168575 RepID=A0AAD9XD74_9ROSI|nr:hypothetical protein Ddye_009850 [Dipteronia dyeriana]
MVGRRVSDQPGCSPCRNYGKGFGRRSNIGANDRNRRIFISDITFNEVVCKEPNDVRHGIMDFFNNHFQKIHWNRPSIESVSLKKLEDFESRGLEEEFTLDEVDGSLIKELNYTFIALIPKVSKPSTMGDFRPISLVGSMYKVVAKFLVNRIKKVMASIIGESQMAFVKNRQILDSFVIAEEVIHKWRKVGESGLLVKLDFEKVYDSVDHSFFEEMLVKMGFGSKWRNWIKGCISTATMSILVNAVAFVLNPSNMSGKILRHGIQVIVGKPTKIRLWQDVMIDLIPLKLAFPRIYALVVDKEGFISDNGKWNQSRWEWKVDLRRAPFDWEKSQWNCFKRWLNCLVVRKEVEDTITWSFSSSGVYSVCSLRIKLEELSTGEQDVFNLPWKG